MEHHEVAQQWNGGNRAPDHRSLQDRFVNRSQRLLMIKKSQRGQDQCHEDQATLQIMPTQTRLTSGPGSLLSIVVFYSRNESPYRTAIANLVPE